ncbi:MAG: hypothetical protein QF632_03580 [Candidatus Woesearchaeota archaeon]|nr:hypothetical protein [Candidatus Woesearchaeota archaeon]MDP7457443.1 hypothetical protein [Candidatus Woesearchaeota archaeon]
MKKWLLLLVLLTSGCNLVGFGVDEPYTFEKGFNEMLGLDEKYGADFYNEALDVENRFSDGWTYDYDWERTLVSLDDIESMIEELKVLEEKVAGMEETEDIGLVLRLLDTRVKMLESERLYQEGLKVGSRGDTDDGFKCGDMPFIRSLTGLWNESSIVGQEATKEWDDFLTHHSQTRPFLSSDKRPKFYDSPFWPIRRFSGWNIGRVERFCEK